MNIKTDAYVWTRQALEKWPNPDWVEEAKRDIERRLEGAQELGRLYDFKVSLIPIWGVISSSILLQLTEDESSKCVVTGTWVIDNDNSVYNSAVDITTAKTDVTTGHDTDLDDEYDSLQDAIDSYEHDSEYDNFGTLNHEESPEDQFDRAMKGI